MAAAPEPPSRPRPFRRTLALVMTVQVVTLLILWLLQHQYHG